MTFRLTPEQRTELARNHWIRAVTGKGLTKEQRAELCRSADNLEAANKLQQRMEARKKLN